MIRQDGIEPRRAQRLHLGIRKLLQAEDLHVVALDQGDDFCRGGVSVVRVERHDARGVIAGRGRRLHTRYR